MVSRTARSVALGTWLLAAFACSNSTEPDVNDRVPEVRGYAYRMTTTAYGDIRTFTGTLTITYASPDSIAGRLNGVALEPEMTLGFWNVDAYVLYGYVIGGGTTIAHRLARRSNGLSCEARVIRNTSAGFVSTPSSCTLE